MSPLFEIFAQLFFLYIAAWLIYRAYKANLSAPSILGKFSQHASTEKAMKDFGTFFIAGGFLTGLTIFILFVNKIIICGLVCGTLLP